MFPRSQTSQWTLLLSSSSMNSQQTSSSSLQHPSIGNRLINLRKDSQLASDRNLQALAQRADNLRQQVPVVLKVSSVVTALGDRLRTPNVNINRVAVRLGQQSCLQESRRVVPTKLNYQGTILRCAGQELFPVLGVPAEDRGVKHRRVTQLSAVAPG